MIDRRKLRTHRENRKRRKSCTVHQPHVTTVTVTVWFGSFAGASREKGHSQKSRYQKKATSTFCYSPSWHFPLVFIGEGCDHAKYTDVTAVNIVNTDKMSQAFILLFLYKLYFEVNK